MNLPSLKTFAAVSVLLGAVSLVGCGGGSSSSNDTPSTDAPTQSTAAEGTAQYVTENSELKGDFSEDVTLVAGTTYKITGEVNFLEGTTLTIPAGTTLYGTSGSSYLAINRGAMIMAEGTAANPIVFTSAQDVAGTAEQNAQGQWGGLTILGKSTNNKGERTYEAGTQKYGPVDGVTTEADNSGVLRYVIVKYSGFEVETDKELNGVSLGSVGSGTTIENLAIIGSADDGIEFWGGTVNVTNLYVYNAGDDSLDTDQGFTGTLENVFVQQVVVDDEVDSRAIEADSFDTTSAGDFISKPVLKDATLNTIGRAIRLREGTGYVFDNVQVNVQSSDADRSLDGTDHDSDPTTDDYNYAKEVAAIRVSDTTITGAEIEIAAGGLAVKNDAVDYAANDSAAGDITATGDAAGGLGIYRDSDSEAVFTGKDIRTTVGVSGDMVDEGFLDSDGSVFTMDVDANNTVTGADLDAFDWAINASANADSVEVLTGNITADMTLSADTLYAINGEVNVLDGVTLTIPAGTTLFGASGSSYLAINRGAMIIANGTATDPIVFTSAQDIAGQNTGEEQGQWGGLTILGKASANKGERTYEAGSQSYGPVNLVATDNDNSGVLNYVVVKYTGYEVEKDKELNGISLAAVGSGTTISNIASIGSADDGIELWGGTVSIDGLYVYNAGDDSIDTDQGYVGTISNVYAEQSVVDDETGSRVIEADSHSTDVTGTPQSHVTMENATLLSVGRAVRLREGTNYTFDGVQITQKSGSDAVFRASDTAAEVDGGAATTFSVGTNGLFIDVTATSSALNHNTETSDLSAWVDVQSGTNSNVTAYDFSWAQ